MLISPLVVKKELLFIFEENNSSIKSQTGKA